MPHSEWSASDLVMAEIQKLRRELQDAGVLARPPESTRPDLTAWLAEAYCKSLKSAGGGSGN